MSLGAATLGAYAVRKTTLERIKSLGRCRYLYDPNYGFRDTSCDQGVPGRRAEQRDWLPSLWGNRKTRSTTRARASH